VTLLRASDVRAQDLEVLAVAARVVIDTAPLAEALENEAPFVMSFDDRFTSPEPLAKGVLRTGELAPALDDPSTGEPQPEREPLEFFNGLGGFARDGQEYVIRIERGPDLELRLPPRPWINVIANERSDVWSARLAPVHLERKQPRAPVDAVANDRCSTAWRRALPARRRLRPILVAIARSRPGRSPAGYEMTHGFGHSRCRHDREGLGQEVSVFVAPHDPVRFVRVRVANRSGRARRVTLFSYQQLVLGASPDESERFVITASGEDSRALTARNPLAADYASTSPSPRVRRARRCVRSIAAAIGRRSSAWRSLEAPAALRRTEPLDGHVGAGLDPCFALQAGFDLAAGAELECVFVLGEGASATRRRICSRAIAIRRRSRKQGGKSAPNGRRCSRPFESKHPCARSIC